MRLLLFRFIWCVVFDCDWICVGACCVVLLCGCVVCCCVYVLFVVVGKCLC